MGENIFIVKREATLRYSYLARSCASLLLSCAKLRFATPILREATLRYSDVVE